MFFRQVSTFSRSFHLRMSLSRRRWVSPRPSRDGVSQQAQQIPVVEGGISGGETLSGYFADARL
jgi:hypothetical protein